MVFCVGANFVRQMQSDSSKNMNGINVAIIDYGMGNLFSIRRACEKNGIRCSVTTDASVIDAADGLILPGVGAFGDAMDHLQQFDLVGPIRNFIASGRPFMGICLGMQLLMSESEEFGVHKGLGIIEGTVKRMPSSNNDGKKIKVPEVGWNQIFQPENNHADIWKKTPLKDIPNGSHMYFVHSYYPIPTDGGKVLSTSTYGNLSYCSSICWNNIFATQYHPERSELNGIKIYKNWISIIELQRNI